MEKGFSTGHEAMCTAKQNCKAQQGKMWSWQKYFCTAEMSAAPTHTRATFATSQVSPLLFQGCIKKRETQHKFAQRLRGSSTGCWKMLVPCCCLSSSVLGQAMLPKYILPNSCLKQSFKGNSLITST